MIESRSSTCFATQVELLRANYSLRYRLKALEVIRATRCAEKEPPCTLSAREGAGGIKVCVTKGALKSVWLQLYAPSVSQ